MSLLVLVSIWNDDLRTLLSQSIDQVPSQESSASEYGSYMTGNRRSSTTIGTISMNGETRLSLDDEIMNSSRLLRGEGGEAGSCDGLGCPRRRR